METRIQRITHHGKPGGRALELILLFCLIILTIGIFCLAVGAGALLGVLLGSAFGWFRGVMIFGAYGGGWVAVKVIKFAWRKFLDHYRYNNDLTPKQEVSD